MRYVITMACALVLAACGGAEPSAAPAESDETARDTARTKLQQCLREQGIEQPAQADEGKVREALDGPCKEYRQGAFGGTDPRDDPEFQDAMTRFQACMRDEGIEFKPGQMDRSDPKFQDAIEQCRDELPENLR